MTDSIRIATWNLARPGLNGWKHGPALLDRMREVDADIWILTETNSRMVPESNASPETTYASVATERCEFHSVGENCTTVWSRFGILRTMETWDPGMAVCAEIDSPLGPLLVYGTLITYADDKGREGTSRRWQEHRQAARGNVTDWLRLCRELAGHSMCVAGDFNQNRDGTIWYCDAEAESVISAGLTEAGMRCVTEHNLRVLNSEIGRANIDHICISTGLTARVDRDSYWMTKSSDHNGVFADVSLRD